MSAAHVAVAIVNVGDTLYPDDGFTCMDVNMPVVVKAEYADEMLARSLLEMIDAYGSDGGHGPVEIIERAKQALVASSELYVECSAHKIGQIERHYLSGQLQTIDGVECYVGLSKEPWT